MRKHILWLFAPLLATLAAPAGAQNLVIGTPGQAGNCLPLGCAVPYHTAVWQQVYDASNFNGPVTITTVTLYSTAVTVFSPPQFNSTGGGGMTYTVSLSTTTKPLNGLASPYTANLGSDNTIIATRTLTGTVTSPVSFGPGPAFHYDPSQGNLLLTIQLTSQNAGNNVAYFDSNDDTGRSTRAYFDSTGLVEQGWLGVLVTGFDAVPAGTCSISLPTASAQAPAIGGQYTFSVTASAGACSHAAASNVPWLTVTSGATGQGSGSVGYTVGSNFTGATRSGTITVAGQTFTVTQTGTAPATVTSTPSGISVTVDGRPYVTPASFQWIPNSTHTLTAPQMQPGQNTGVRFPFGFWKSETGQQVTSPSVTITAKIGGNTENAAYGTQYELVTNAAGNGTISPATGWYNAGTPVTVTATPGTGAYFIGFSGNLTGSTSPQTLTMTSPQQVTASFGNLTPVLSASIGTKSDGALPNERVWTIVVKNTGQGPATNARITAVNILQTAGTATVTASPQMILPVSLGTIPPNGSATGQVRLIFPATTPASKIQIQIGYAADGYSGSATFSSQYR